MPHSVPGKHLMDVSWLSDVLPTYGGDLKPRSLVVMTSCGRKSKKFMKWLSQELQELPEAEMALRTSSSSLFLPLIQSANFVTYYECGDKEVNFWSIGKMNQHKLV